MRTRTARALAALALTGIAWGQIASENQITLQAGTAINLDNGVAVTAGGDLLWTGNNLTPQGNAKVYNFGQLSLSVYNSLNLTSLTQYVSLVSPNPIPIYSLAPQLVLMVVTNRGNIAKIQILNSPAPTGNASLSFAFTTYVVSANPPTISSVCNGSSFIPAGLPNSGIAPSTLFAIVGNYMAVPGSIAVLQDSTKGLPTTLNGASIAVTVGGKTVFPALYFATPTELAAVLPASTPIGAGTITVTYNNVVTAPFPIDVVPSAYGIDVYNGSMAVATDALSGALLTPIASGQPGQVVILWGTGLGSDPGDSDTTYSGSPQPIQTQVDAYVGGVKVPKIAYAGGSVYPGVHVIGFTIPQGVPNGCYVPVIVITGGSTISNGPTLPIADDGGVCSDPALGIDGDMISRFNAQPVTRIGALTVGLQTSPGAGTPNTFSYALASFQSRPGMPFMGAGVLSVGTCTVGSGSVSTPSDSITGLDPGIVTVTDPSGASTALANELDDMGDYQTQWHPSNIPPSGGTFMFGGSGGAGSTEVGPFTATVNFPQLTNWTNQSAFSTVSRSSPQSFTWGAGSPGSYITVGSSSSSGQAHGSYSCSLPADGGQAAVPSYLLLALPAGIGTTTFEAWTVPTTFTAGNLDYGFATTFIGVSVKSTVQ